MNTKQMDYCIELAQTLHFSKAAENLFVSQPSFSYQIKLLEEEVGFRIFDRSGRGASLTPAGEQFVHQLRSMRQSLQRAIEQGQNFSAKYRQSISIGLINRQSLCFLPQAMKEMQARHPHVQISLHFHDKGNLERFLKNELDLYFGLEEETRQLPDTTVHPLFRSRIYLISTNDDPLAGKSPLTQEDLYGRTLMVGGGSPPALRSLQQRLIDTGRIDYFNSADHDTTLTHVAAGNGICLAPGFLNDRSNLFTWTPFSCHEHFSCVLCSHKNDQRPELADFLRILKNLYANADEELL